MNDLKSPYKSIKSFLIERGWSIKCEQLGFAYFIPPSELDIEDGYTLFIAKRMGFNSLDTGFYTRIIRNIYKDDEGVEKLIRAVNNV